MTTTMTTTTRHPDDLSGLIDPVSAAILSRPRCDNCGSRDNVVEVVCSEWATPVPDVSRAEWRCADCRRSRVLDGDVVQAVDPADACDFCGGNGLVLRCWTGHPSPLIERDCHHVHCARCGGTGCAADHAAPPDPATMLRLTARQEEDAMTEDTTTGRVTFTLETHGADPERVTGADVRDELDCGRLTLVECGRINEIGDDGYIARSDADWAVLRDEYGTLWLAVNGGGNTDWAIVLDTDDDLTKAIDDWYNDPDAFGRRD